MFDENTSNTTHNQATSQKTSRHKETPANYTHIYVVVARAKIILFTTHDDDKLIDTMMTLYLAMAAESKAYCVVLRAEFSMCCHCEKFGRVHLDHT